MLNNTTTKHTEVTMSKQTATQYLIEEIKNDSFVQAKSTQEWNEVFRKALQMEREQIIDADLAGVERTLLDFSKFPNLVGYLKKTLSLVNDIKEGRDTHDNGIEYYNETYGNHFVDANEMIDHNGDVNEMVGGQDE